MKNIFLTFLLLLSFQLHAGALMDGFVLIEEELKSKTPKTIDSIVDKYYPIVVNLNETIASVPGWYGKQQFSIQRKGNAISVRIIYAGGTNIKDYPLVCTYKIEDNLDFPVAVWADDYQTIKKTGVENEEKLKPSDGRFMSVVVINTETQEVKHFCRIGFKAFASDESQNNVAFEAQKILWISLNEYLTKGIRQDILKLYNLK